MPSTLPTPLQGEKLSEQLVATTLPADALVPVLLPSAGPGQKKNQTVLASSLGSSTQATLDPGTVLHFNQLLTLHGEVATGSFTVDTGAMIPGSEESIVLGPAATLPTTADTTTGGVTTPATLDPTIFHTTSPAPQAGRVLEYLFRVGYDGQHV
ncbi:MAG: hypothetical protein ACRYFX_09890, partial [Janthinobacterium lividum]